MAKHIEGPWIITANRLTDGRVVYLAPGDSWDPSAERAKLLKTEAQRDGALARAEEDERSNHVIAPEAVGAETHSGAPVPVRLRERIRAEGPTIDALELARRHSGGG